MSLSRRELTVLVAAFVVSLPAVTPRIYASDEIQYFSYLRSLWFDRDVSFENEYQYFFDQNIGRGEGFHATFLEQFTGAGRRPSFATLGSAILWMPFYAAADVITLATGGVRDGFSAPYIAAVAYGSAFYGFVAVLLSIGAARRLAGAGLLAGVLIWLGTPLLFYMYVAPPYSHACSAFAVALFVTIWLHVRERWSIGGAIALGVSGALMAMVREQDALLAVGPTVDFLVWAFTDGRAATTSNEPDSAIGSARGPSEARTRRARASGGGPPPPRLRQAAPKPSEGEAPRALSNADTWRIAACGALAFAVGFLPQLLAYQGLNGHFGPSRLVTRKMSWHAPHALGVVGSPEHGFLVWTPLAALAIAGLVLLALRGGANVRRIAWCALIMVAIQIYVSGSVDSWTVAGAFGQRRFVALTILLTIGLAAWLASIPRGAWRPVSAVIVGLCVWWNVALIAQFGTGLMNRQRLELRRNAYAAFVTLPRVLPDLVYRYLADRDSFYSRRKPGAS